ncbi:trehalose-phosphatase [Nocardiopsis algeriensis]|uniref:Trehalose 6-phosphate phosphatase n=1 Tax=Nocardiopsis algeriensis TaxID=1478215 RepID=A0A841IJC7_9ACTN|nr:trehalose-phosphatase [Nocardiopsis algeriensis]MBB6118220.1 trehalose 6-phosphate phosphatase [Nocardiopsis algeriensis]
MSLPQPSTDTGRTALEALLEKPSGLLAAFDFDGTLAPVVEDPEASAPYPGIVEQLTDLASLVGNVAVVTGRPAATAVRLGGLERVPGITVLGHYGAERWVDGRLLAADPPPGVSLVRQELPGLLERTGAPEGTWIEDKGRSLAVHTRRAAEPEAALAMLIPHLSELAERADLQLEPGRLVMEIRPSGVDKGEALTALVTERQADTVLFAGDDLGDLPAFEAVAQLRERGVSGLSVCVHSSEVAVLSEVTDLLVEGPAGLSELLGSLIGAIRAQRS